MTLAKLALKNIDSTRPLVIAGPCSAESREQVVETARQLAEGGIKIMRAGIWKPRTKPGGFEGVGSIGLEWLSEAKRLTGIGTATEVATPDHVEKALNSGIDLLWIGARTTTNPFAVQEITDSLRGVDIPVLIKNPVNPDIELWCGAIERMYNAGLKDIGVIHRGFSTYEQKLYRNLPLWNIPIELRRRHPELTILCDPSHIGGRRALIAPIAQQALELNFDGLIIESHHEPQCALSDAEQQVTPRELFEILHSLTIRVSSIASEDISILREKIDSIDTQVLNLLSQRMEISKEIGAYKEKHNIAILQSTRYDEILKERGRLAESLNLSSDFATQIIKLIHEESVNIQLKKPPKNGRY